MFVIGVSTPKTKNPLRYKYRAQAMQTCPTCGCQAYLGLNTVECSNSGCELYSAAFAAELRSRLAVELELVERSKPRDQRDDTQPFGLGGWQLYLGTAASLKVLSSQDMVTVSDRTGTIARSFCFGFPCVADFDGNTITTYDRSGGRGEWPVTYGWIVTGVWS